ncbi:hypothetical protein K438DRAFT_413762 [Mycena galopus ATCC 62051]|nr:hypothetical protein K438DRAFT_413762 [Mycena galopus ATCC 62051]
MRSSRARQRKTGKEQKGVGAVTQVRTSLQCRHMAAGFRLPFLRVFPLACNGRGRVASPRRTSESRYARTSIRASASAAASVPLLLLSPPTSLLLHVLLRLLFAVPPVSVDLSSHRYHCPSARAPLPPPRSLPPRSGGHLLSSLPLTAPAYYLRAPTTWLTRVAHHFAHPALDVRSLPSAHRQWTVPTPRVPPAHVLASAALLASASAPTFLRSQRTSDSPHSTSPRW